MNAVPKVKRRKKLSFRTSLVIPYAIFMALFVILPLFLILYYAFTDKNGNFTFDIWGNVFANSTNWKVIGNTFLIAFLTTLICILIAYPIAYLLANSKYNKNRILVYIFLLPMWINFVIRTMGLKDLLYNLTYGLFGWSLTTRYPVVAIVIGMVYDYLPFAILPLYNQMLKLDKNQIEAAADLGANPVRVFTRSIIPQTIPGIVSACMMTFMPTMSSYVIANNMSENKKSIIGNLIQQYFVRGGEHEGSILALVMLFIVGITLVIEKAFDKSNGERKGDLW